LNEWLKVEASQVVLVTIIVSVAKPRKTGRTIGGYTPAKLKIRELKRQQPYIAPKEDNE
jgi:hypothetical protein